MQPPMAGRSFATNCAREMANGELLRKRYTLGQA
ncbi:hypothetical protein EV666_1402 [Camelimonas lactis]|uniref:Uncharacterized protein n=1 Tax=Camelimonas lactis TaxID=659006 RepID=A0A4R2GFQ4_9HYPH|nr:hypothetical protein EV666_1402 [Camelimonas lactis]